MKKILLLLFTGTLLYTCQNSGVNTPNEPESHSISGQIRFNNPDNPLPLRDNYYCLLYHEWPPRYKPVDSVKLTMSYGTADYIFHNLSDGVYYSTAGWLENSVFKCLGNYGTNTDTNVTPTKIILSGAGRNNIDYHSHTDTSLKLFAVSTIDTMDVNYNDLYLFSNESGNHDTCLSGVDL